MPGVSQPPVASLRLAFWNTWLLAPRFWRGGPRVPGLPTWYGPDVTERAPLVAAAVRDRFDVVALSEVWDPVEQAAVAAGWPEARWVEGPGRRFPRVTGSGLGTLLAPSVELVRSARYTYRAAGDPRDADWFSSKGALFTSVSVHPGLPPVEVLSTHLFAGGDLIPAPGAHHEPRHHRVRLDQLDELIGFIERMHDPACVLLVVGDLNVGALDEAGTEPTSRYEDLVERMARAELVDLWAEHGVGPGHTCTFDGPDDLPPDPDEPDQVVDDPAADPRAIAGERIDYLFLHVPEGVEVEVERPRRWAFPRTGVTGGVAGSLSDHLALSTTLHLR